ncbi:MAG: hypothetical protein PVS3B3_16930 [Ktedonobacteraceae bacterium]
MSERFEQNKSPHVFVSDQETLVNVPITPRYDSQSINQSEETLQLPITPLPGSEFPFSVQANHLDPNSRRAVIRYAEWLASQAKNNNSTTAVQEGNDYIEQATKVVKVNGKDISIFAPYRAEHSALQTFSKKQVIALAVMTCLWLIGVAWLRLGMLTATVTVIMILYLGHLILDMILASCTFRQSTESKIDDEIVHALANADWPNYTILCPLYKEARVVPQFVKAMQALDYPVNKLQVLFLTEEDDKETREAIWELQLPPHFKVVTVPDGKPRTKPRACNFGLLITTGPYVVIYDAEDVPDPLQLKKAILTFANHGPSLACVQAKLNFYNPQQNLLTRFFTLEYSLWFDLILPGLQQVGFSLPLGGTSNHFQTKTLRALGGWDAYNVTEDCDLGLRLSRYQFETAVLDSTTYEEANSQVKNWIRQRSRWIKGYMQTYLIYMRQPQRYLKANRFREFLSLQLIVGGKTLTLFVNPLMWVLLAIYILFRPYVQDVYQTLFPPAVLYMGIFCLVFGNFFHIYMYLLGGLKRKQYLLVKWALFIPFYWVLLSTAAMMAFYELLLKPHYWQKTQHGLHLKGKNAIADVTYKNAAHVQDGVDDHALLVASVTKVLQLPEILMEEDSKSKISSVTGAIKVMSTLPVPAFSYAQKVAQREIKRAKVRDPWLIITLFTALTASILSCLYYFQQHQILLYDDAESHLTVARKFIDNVTPFDITQFGAVWLPLPHILMLPFIWNDFLWRTGLAGSFVSMICYVLVAYFLFLTARRLTNDSRASFIGALLFMLNPNILYIQSTPLSEIVCMATLIMICYYLLVWVQEDRQKYLLALAASTFLATSARYDGWALFIALIPLIIAIGLAKRQRYAQIEAHVLVFAVLGGLGIGLWFLWNKVIFGDPLYFQHGQFSSANQAVGFLQAHELLTYHNLWLSFRYYTIDSAITLGPLLLILSVFALVIFLLRKRLTEEMLAVSILLVPFCFYVLSLYAGQAILFVPGAVPANAFYQLFNVRYASQMVVPCAFFVAAALGRWQIRDVRRRNMVRKLVAAVQGIVLIAIVVQSLLVASHGIITVQDGQYGLSCSNPHPINMYLAQHYAGGHILEDTYTAKIYAGEAGVDFKDFIYEGSNASLWENALRDPAHVVNWVIVDTKNPQDIVGARIDVTSAAFLSQFTLAVREPTGDNLYYRSAAGSLPTRPAPEGLLTPHLQCKRG